MATPKAQRIGIWIITVVMTIGVVGSFLVMILSTKNQEQDNKAQQKVLEEKQKQQQEAVKQSAKYFPMLNKYHDTPQQFDPTTVGTTVTKKDLKVGTGAEVKSDSNYQAYYIGWNPDGKVFDSSFADSSSLKAVLDTATLGGPGGLIKGWTEGVVGMKEGGIRQLTIPAKLAYGTQSPSPDIPANTPLKFIIYIVKVDK